MFLAPRQYNKEDVEIKVNHMTHDQREQLMDNLESKQMTENAISYKGKKFDIYSNS